MHLLDWLIKRYPTAKRQTFKRMIGDRRVLVDGAPARSLRQEIPAESKIVVREHVERVESMSRKLPRVNLDVVFEDADILVVNKPAGLLTSTVQREPRPTLLKLVREYVAQQDVRGVRAGLIHRIDRDASGLLIFSKNADAFRLLKTQFFKHTVQRVYTAVVVGVPTQRQGRMNTRLVELVDGAVRSTKVEGKGQRAITEYDAIEDDGTRSLLRVRLHTGRKHQIRVHLSERGFPIVGDRVYGAAGDSGNHRRLLLHASELQIVHPRTGKPMTFSAEAPAEFRAALGRRSAP